MATYLSIHNVSSITARIQSIKTAAGATVWVLTIDVSTTEESERPPRIEFYAQTREAVESFLVEYSTRSPT